MLRSLLYRLTAAQTYHLVNMLVAHGMLDEGGVGRLRTGAADRRSGPTSSRSARATNPVHGSVSNWSRSSATDAKKHVLTRYPRADTTQMRDSEVRSR